MNTYTLEIDYKKADRSFGGVGFIPNFPYNPKIVETKSINLDHLRARIFSEYLKRTGTALVYIRNKDGRRRYLGKAFNYGQGEIYWEVGESDLLQDVDPKTGKLKR